MSNAFFRVLLAGVLILSVGSLGLVARSLTDQGGSASDTDGLAPSVLRVGANVPSGHYGPGQSIGLTASLSKPARGTLVAYLSSGVAVALPCVAATCKGDYWVGAGHATDRLDVLFFSGSLTDAEGNRNDAPAVPAGLNLGDGVRLRIGDPSEQVAGPDRTFASAPSRI